MLISLSSRLVFFNLTTYLFHLVSSLSLGCRILFCLLSFSLSGCFLGSPGDTVLPSCLTNRHGQNEFSSVLPKPRLSPRGNLAGRISNGPVGSAHTDCDRPRASLPPHTLNRIMQLCLHRRARSMGWTTHANSCQGDTLVR